MSEKKFARAAANEALDTMKTTHEFAVAALRESNANLVIHNEELRAKLHAAGVKAAELTALQSEAKEVASLVGKDTLADARGVFAALKAEIDKTTMRAGAAEAKLAKIETDAKVAKLSQLVDKGIAEGKISPAEKPLFLGQTAEFVETILAVRPVMVKMNETSQGQPATPGTPSNLSPELQELAKTLGWDIAKIQTSGGVPLV